MRSGGDDQNNVATDQHVYAYITGDTYTTTIFGQTTLTPFGFEDAFVAKFNCDLSTLNLTTNNRLIIIDLFPNPNSGSFKIKLEDEMNNAELILMNSLGQKVHDQKNSKR